MAMTATIATNPTTAVTGQKVICVLTVSNSGGNAINLTNISPYVKATDATDSTINSGVSIGNVEFGPGANTSVAAGGSLVITFPVTFHAPSSGVLSDVAQTYSVGASCYSDDGSVFKPTEDTITVNYAVTYPESQQ